MSARSWFYTDANGVRQEEALSSRQGIFDDAILRDFGALENTVSEGKTINTDSNKTTIANMQKLINSLPKQRALHWVAELERIGAIARSGESAKLVAASESEKLVKQKGDQGDSK